MLQLMLNSHCCLLTSFVQVPHRIGQLSCQLLDTAWDHAAPLAAKACAVLLVAANKSGVSADVVEDSFPSPFHVNDSKRAIALKMRQQLQESGFLQRLLHGSLRTALSLLLSACQGCQR